jgi:uncharacterized membrane protein YphA (DoxX/SURF4 family)
MKKTVASKPHARVSTTNHEISSLAKGGWEDFHLKDKSGWSWKAGLFFACRLILGGIFIYASLDKIFKPDLFAEAVFNYQVLPNNLINLTALVLPWVELVLGLMLIAGFWLPGAVLLSILLLLTFIGTLIFNIARGFNINCGCFSTEPSTDPITWWTVLRDASFLVPAFFLLLVNRPGKNGR